MIIQLLLRLSRIFFKIPFQLNEDEPVHVNNNKTGEETDKKNIFLSLNVGLDVSKDRGKLSTEGARFYTYLADVNGDCSD